jgi:hypothetical protein
VLRQVQGGAQGQDDRDHRQGVGLGQERHGRECAGERRDRRGVPEGRPQQGGAASQQRRRQQDVRVEAEQGVVDQEWRGRAQHRGGGILRRASEPAQAAHRRDSERRAAEQHHA